MLMRFLLLMSVVANFSHPVCAEDRDVNKAKRLVQAALEAEVTGSAEDRDRFLAEAGAVSKVEESARWQLGQFKVGRDWSDYSTLVAKAKKSKDLEGYRELRDASLPTVASQTQLASYCLKHGMSNQAVAHWSAILELDTENAEARKQLGFKRLEGRWVQANELDRAQQIAKKVASNLRQNQLMLKDIAQDLQSLKITHEMAVEKVSEDADVNSIPVWELCLSTAHRRGALVVVDALDQMSAPEASLSLSRHALWTPHTDVREAAIAALKKRDPHSFIPALLSELRGPWIASRQVVRDGLNRLVVRYSAVADGQDRLSLRVMDEVYFLAGDLALAGGVSSSDATQSTLVKEFARRQENSTVEFRNSQISDILSKVTERTDLKTPQDWWQWWDNKNEVYSAEEKPILTSYSSRTALVDAPYAPAPRSSTWDDKKKDCLAGGTPILTQRGPIAIERVRIGDLVLSKHPDSGELRLQPVLRTTVREPEQLICITVQNADPEVSHPTHVIRASGGHPFWVSGNGWVRARNIKVGMRLHGLSQFSEVKSVEVEEKATRTYNLIVNDFHSYFAGNEQVLSHDNTVIEPVRCRVPGLVE